MKNDKIIPIWKFILFSVITLGIYELFWIYKTWKFIKLKKKINISPLARTIFSPIFVGGLSGYVKNYLNSVDIKCNYSPGLIGISYFLITIGSKNLIVNNLYYLLLLLIIYTIPLLPIVNSMNLYYKKQSYLKKENKDNYLKK